MPENLFNTNVKTCNWRHNSHSVRKYQFIYHFLPHPQENRRATLLSAKSLAIYCLLIVLVTGLFRLIPEYFPDLLSDTNKIRESSGLSDLTMNSLLSEAAAKKAAHMFKNGYWAHVAPDGTEPWDFILGENYDYIYAGENLAKNFSDSEGVVEAWYNSPSHKENLLNPHYSEVGFAVVNGTLNGYETTLVVQMFGRPRNPTQMATVDTTDVSNIKPQMISTRTETPTYAVPTDTHVYIPSGSQQGSVKPLMDVRTASKSISILLGLFLTVLLSLDIWYTRRFGVVKLNGHTWIHLSFLIIAMAGIWFVFNPGSVL
jgi:hypothetical protein